jgi:hypothetical protein
MCDITLVRNALLLLAAAVVLATSSATFGLAFANAGPLAWLMYVGLGAAIVWSIPAAAELNSATKALNTFCSCTGAIPACSEACTFLRGLLALIATVLLVMVGACAAKILNPANAVAATVIAVAVLVLSLSLFFQLLFGLRLDSCQPPRG